MSIVSVLPSEILLCAILLCTEQPREQNQNKYLIQKIQTTICRHIHIYNIHICMFYVDLDNIKNAEF